MAAIIDSAPDCVTHNEVYSADDAADFVVGDNYTECAGFMTFGPGSTYGEEGVGANGAYMVLTWIGIVFMVVVLVGWVAYENRRLVNYAATRLRGGPPATPQPGTTGAEDEGLR
jgi:hypothetical protein